MLEYVIKLVAGAIGLSLTSYITVNLVPPVVEFLKQKNLYNKITKLVKGVELLYKQGKIPKIDKKEEVIKALEESGVTVDRTTELIVEAIVGECTNAGSKVKDAFMADAESEEINQE